MTRTVEDSAIMLSAIAGYDPKDSTSARLDVPDFAKAFENVNVKGLRVGIPKEFKSDQLSEDMISLWEKAAKWFSDAGAEIKEISLPHTKYGLPAYYIIAPAEASSNLARYDGVRYGLRVEGEDLHDMYKKTRDAGFGAEVKRRILIGTAVLSAGFYDAYYTQAAKIRRLIAHDFNDAFEDVDVLLTPTTPSPAFALDEQLSPIDMYLNDVLTVTCNLAGVPAMSIPAGFASNGLPLGLQIIGNKFNETLLFRVGKFIENMRGFENRPSMINS
jgi:aspartyl-tRNA(Asn)/glutamyl-tRNA(Gln) amidotransferase subunit A